MGREDVGGGEGRKGGGLEEDQERTSEADLRFFPVMDVLDGTTGGSGCGGGMKWPV